MGRRLKQIKVNLASLRINSSRGGSARATSAKFNERRLGDVTNHAIDL